jgi:predicted glycosyltransferase
MIDAPNTDAKKEQRMKFLFFFVHPSKYYLFRNTITRLKAEGHQVDVAIVSKDVLEELLIQGGIEFKNIFPEGRRISGLPILLGTAINFLRTIWRLLKLIRGRKYDLFITDDVLTIVGWLTGVPSLMFTDDDLSVVPETSLLLATTTKVIAPEVTDLGRFSGKKIPLRGFKEMAYLTAEYFSPSETVMLKFNPDRRPYAIIRLVSLTASHDAGREGLGDARLMRLIGLLERRMKVFITSERELPASVECYRLSLPVNEIAHALYFADLFVGDSQTMTSEAAILGTPAVRYNDFVGRIRSMEVKETKYGLTLGFKTSQFEEMIAAVESLLQQPDLKKEWQAKAQRLAQDCEDVNEAIYRSVKLLALHGK